MKLLKIMGRKDTLLYMATHEFPSFRISERILLFAITFLMLTFCVSCLGKPRLLLPYDTVAISENNGEKTRNFSCQPVPASVKEMVYFSIYSSKDESRSIVDPVALKKYKKATGPLSSYEKNLVKMSNLFLAHSPGQGDIASCVLDWLNGWGKDRALLGRTNHTGKLVRKGALATLASAYAQIMENKDLDFEKIKNVEHWLNDLAYNVVHDFSVKPERNSRRNNHLYWAAWSVALTGIVLQDRVLFDWAIEKARFGLAQVKEDGTLPLEMIRLSKAFSYHVHAVGPLVMLAETASWNSINLYDAENGALHRLVKRVLSGLDDASYFKKRTGKEQDLDRTATSHHLAWVEVYHKRFPNKRAEKWLKKLRPMRSSRMGGNLTLLWETNEK